MKKLILFIVCASLSIMQVAAQNSTTMQSSNSKNETKQEFDAPFASILGVQLTVLKKDQSAEVLLSKDTYSTEKINTVEDKLRYKSGLDALSKLKEAKSFNEVVEFASEKLELQSHQVVNFEDRVVHYFIFIR